MPRYRFQWDNLPYRVQLSLCSHLGLDRRDAARSLRKRYRARPREDFVADAWPVLRDDWLGRDRTVRRAAILNLRAAGLGLLGDVPLSPQRERNYLLSVRNTKPARAIVLATFIAAGEIPPLHGRRRKPKSDAAPRALGRPRRVTDPGYHKNREPANKGESYPAEVLSPAEIAALIHACPDTAAGIRLRALIAVLYRAGLRIAEALDLRLSDVDPGHGTIVVMSGKGGMRRTCGIDPVAMDLLVAWLERRG